MARGRARGAARLREHGQARWAGLPRGAAPGGLEDLRRGCGADTRGPDRGSAGISLSLSLSLVSLVTAGALGPSISADEYE